jgi:hypothetical protein
MRVLQSWAKPEERTAMFTRMLGIAVLLILAGCASTPDRVSPDALAKIRKVGVMSLAAHEFDRKYTGLTVFGNEYEKQDISAWNVDDEYESQMHRAVQGLARFEAVRIPYQRKDFYRVYELNGPYDAPAFRTPKWSAVEEPLKLFASKHSLDAIIVVVRRESQDFLAGTNQYFRGAGFYARGMGEITAVSVLHLLASVAIIDGQTGKPLVVKDLYRANDGYPTSIAQATPMTKAPPELPRMKLDQLSAERIAAIRTQLIELPKDAWEPTLRAMLGANPG